MLLKDKTALITGAARGIGRAIALHFAAEGADVAFTDLRVDENMESLEKEIRAMGRKGKGYASDASDFQGAEAVVDQVVQDFGKVDILVNNAGITRQSPHAHVGSRLGPGHQGKPEIGVQYDKGYPEAYAETTLRIYHQYELRSRYER